MKKFATIAAAVSLAVLSTAAMAAVNMEGRFDSADSNKDGWVSYIEAQGTVNTLNWGQFNSADANQDGNLDEGEFIGLVTLFG